MPLTQVSPGLLDTQANAQGFRNRIINGDCRVDQRNAGASVTVNTGGAFYPVDRFRFSGVSSSGVFTAQQVTDAPAGFVNSVRATVTTTDSSLTGSDLYYAVQNIEGFNTADLAWGSANAATITMSFWAKSSVTGTFGGALSNNAVNRSYPFTYAISTANTWEYKTVTIAGDTTGTWATDNNTGIRVYFGLGVASGFAGTAGAWAGSQLLSATGAVNLMATNSATWQITGVQLEKGTAATDFERLDYGRQLIQCQRYTYKISSDGTNSCILGMGFANSTTQAFACIYLPVSLRAAPTLTWSGVTISDLVNYTKNASAVSISSAPATGLNIFRLTATDSGLTTGAANQLGLTSSASSNITLSAEL